MSASWAEVLSRVLRPAPRPSTDDVDTFWAAYVAASEPDPFHHAVIAGARADRVGWAFAAGYESALTRLIPERDPAVPGALCVTENGPPHPRRIEARWEDGQLSGHKRYVTLGAHAAVLYVLARSGMHEGRPQLTLLEVDPTLPEVSLRAAAPTPFVPEIPHAEVVLEGAPATPLEGDGWSDYVKPFRTVEDLFVHAAVLAYGLSALVRAGADRAAIEQGLTALCALRSLAAEDPRDPAVHLALHGTMQSTPAVFDALTESDLPEEEKARFERDRRLFRVASAARAMRHEKAWKAI